MQKINIFWFRRDLRLKDNAGLFHALISEFPVLPIFIFDTISIKASVNNLDNRLLFIHKQLSNLNSQLEPYGKTLHCFYGKPTDVFSEIIQKFSIHTVFTNQDYEPFIIKQEKTIDHMLASNGVNFKTFKDHVVFDKEDILKSDGKPYTVFTPYSKKWIDKLQKQTINVYPSNKKLQNLFSTSETFKQSIEIINVKDSVIFPDNSFCAEKIKNYHLNRDYPSIDGTSKLGLHLRYGTISIRELVDKVVNLNFTFLKELIWREFFMQIIGSYPSVVTNSFKPKFDRIIWLNNEADFERWKSGTTGFPMVDAGMRQLNNTGFMHNRLRMITASFLTKHLLIDWRWGEAYFAEKLLDYELSSNNGNWQWAAGCGCDAVPYFRIFNPVEQQKKFDSNFTFIRQMIPEFGTARYPKPMIEHSAARIKTLEHYRKYLAD